MALQGCADLSASRMANLVAPVIVEALEGHRVRFEAITRRAGRRFAARDWKGAVADARERLDLYGAAVGELEGHIRAMLEARVADRLLWAGTKAVYSSLIEGRQDWELAETFFNSVTRRIFSTLGVDSDIEFVDSDFEAPALAEGKHLLRTYPGPQTASHLFQRILADRWFSASFADPARDAGLALLPA